MIVKIRIKAMEGRII
jgi:hypothetical protein